jgi:Tol biopolymer transport system component
VAEGVRSDIGGATYVDFSASANGSVFFPHGSVPFLQPTRYDRSGAIFGTVGEPGLYGSAPEHSPDETRLAVVKRGGAEDSNIWLLDLSRGGAGTRFTFGSRIDSNPVWSPDGSRIIFSSNRDGGVFNLYQKPANGTKDEEILFESAEDKRGSSWSPDGRFLLYTVSHPKTKSDVWVLPLEGGKKPLPLLTSEFNESQARFSPDGHWVAYTSDESGQTEVYVRSFSVNADGTAVEAGEKWAIAKGYFAHWRGDGKEIYLRYQSQIFAVDITTTPQFRAGNPRPLGISKPYLWDAGEDGKRFLSLVPVSGPQPYTIMLNWQAGLKK